VEQKLGEYWQTFETLKKPLLLQDLDFAVRENVKIKIQLLLQSNMEKFIEKGLTYDELENFQQELGLCPTVLESYPRSDKSFIQKVFQLFI
jgi:hypothetical protein